MPKTESTNIDADISGATFDEIAAKYGEEAAINAGIAADPDAFELDDEWFARARPAIEVMPEFVERWEKARATGEIRVREFITVEMDLDIAERLGYDGGERYGDDGWQKRVNLALREMVFGENGERDAAEKSAETAEVGV